MTKLRIGCELEGVYNGDLFQISTEGGYGYRSGERLNSFWVQSYDSSIHENGEFENPKRWELIQHPVVGKDNFKKSLKAFESLAEGNDLKEFVVFNESCGCHMHFSKDKKLAHDVVFSHLGELRKIFFNKLSRLKIDTDVKLAIKKQYNRNYAKEHTEDSFSYMQKDGGSKEYELNTLCEKHGKGLEWRAFNLKGVTDWDTFHKVMMVGYDSLSKFVDLLEQFMEEDEVEITTKANIVKEVIKVKINV